MGCGVLTIVPSAHPVLNNQRNLASPVRVLCLSAGAQSWIPGSTTSLLTALVLFGNQEAYVLFIGHGIDAAEVGADTCWRQPRTQAALHSTNMLVGVRIPSL